MKNNVLLVTALVGSSLAVSCIAGATEEKGEKVKMDSLPAAVQTTIKERAEGAKIVEVKREDDSDGKWNYEAVLMKNGKKSQLEVDPHGTFVREHEPNS